MEQYQDLLRSSLRGDKQAFSEVVRRFSGMANALARQRISDPGLAQDAVQEAFLSAYLALPGLRSLDSFPSWLRAILTTSCSKVLRARLPHAQLSDLEGAEAVAPDDMDPFEHYARFQTRDMILSFLSSLSGVCREAAVQRYMLGRPYDEIAAALGVPVGTVKRRLHEVRERIIRSYGNGMADVIRVGYLPVSDHLLAMVAHQRGDQSSCRVLLRKFLTWSSLVRALVNGTLDAAMLMAPLAMALRNRGQPLYYALDCHHDGSAITVNKDLAVRAVGGRAKLGILAGTTIGLPHARSTHGVLLRTLLGSVGEAPEGTNLRYISPSFVQQAFKRREIDGYFCAEPWNTLAEAEGEGTVLMRSGELSPGHACCVLVVSRHLVENRSAMLQEYLRLLKAAGKHLHARPEECAAIQSRYTGIDTGIAAHVLLKGFISFHDLEPCPSRTRQIMDMAVRTGVLDHPCDLEQFILSCPA